MRISGVDIPDKKRGEISLTYIYGIGRSTAKKILGNKLTFLLIKKLANGQTMKQMRFVLLLRMNLKLKVHYVQKLQLSIKRLMDIGCYRGFRHRKGLPLRGQRTKNNSRTRKGKRKTIANKKKATK